MDALDELVDHLCRSSRLPTGEAQKLVYEVLAYLREDVEGYVRRRHGELQRQGLRNDAIFERLRAELPLRRFAAPDLSARQLRRIVYG
ncbi:MAG: hypothetical protein OXT09_17035 [Myxococcales bacterium]|nr:hypothetical protein [Myxococcales bacterium]